MTAFLLAFALSVSAAPLYHPPKKGKAVALLVHGVGSSKSEWRTLTPKLRELGLGILAIDLRGHGEAEGGPLGYRAFDANGGWPRLLADLEAALAFLKAKGIPASRVGLIGASIGANLCSQLAATRPEIPWVVLLSPGSDYRGVALAPLPSRTVLACASRTDPYAFMTATSLSYGEKLEAKSGHGVQMFDDPAFLKALLAWLKKASNRS